ncbi:hypothetical protein KC614_04120 [candidate division WWE3 bacterium]|uniref:Uncharacterized protein n=1 Tax=candidate division WWE3 bacterium TaxID=2053526 RepID=A0A955LL21_UNCKA|nr:hypothetical protein [candidate division WWE3 bacterium]
MLVKKDSATKVSNSDNCEVFEYRLDSKNVSICTATINGRYPDEGRVANTECEEIYFVISGVGVIHSELGDFHIQEGDTYHFEKGETYWTEGNDLKLVLVNTPKWTPEQHKHI